MGPLLSIKEKATIKTTLRAEILINLSNFEGWAMSQVASKRRVYS